MYGELIPSSGGDPIPLLEKRLRVGRREGNDIVLNFSNVSGHHCLLEIEEGYSFIRDLHSRNGIKVQGKKIMQGLRRRVDPGTTVTIAKHDFVMQYEPTSWAPMELRRKMNRWTTSWYGAVGSSRV